MYIKYSTSELNKAEVSSVIEADRYVQNSSGIFNLEPHH